MRSEFYGALGHHLRNSGALHFHRDFCRNFQRYKTVANICDFPKNTAVGDHFIAFFQRSTPWPGVPLHASVEDESTGNKIPRRSEPSAVFRPDPRLPGHLVPRHQKLENSYILSSYPIKDE